MTGVMGFTGTPSMWGFIPMMINPNDERPLTEQLNEGYAHGGGWRPFDGFEMHADEHGRYFITYPDDPAQHELGRCEFREHETLVMFPHSWVAVVNPETLEFEICRMD